jgi:hypothetical protein
MPEDYYHYYWGNVYPPMQAITGRRWSNNGPEIGVMGNTISGIYDRAIRVM